MYKIIHTIPECMETAFFYIEPPRLGTPLQTSKVRLVNGTTPEGGTLAVCGTCDRELQAKDLRPADGWA